MVALRADIAMFTNAKRQVISYPESSKWLASINSKLIRARDREVGYGWQIMSHCHSGLKIEGELGERSLRVRVQEAFESLIYKSVRVVAEAFLIR